MKRIALISLLAIVWIASCTIPAKEYLFNGENLEGWTIFVGDSTVAPKDFFYVKEGVIETVGVPNGYLRTVKQYADYHLHLEWRYPENPTNSGVFVHTSGPDLLWPAHYQGQLKVENAGDFIVHGVGEYATLGDSTYTSSAEVKPIASKLNPGNENPAGEWNSYDIRCEGNTVELRVNGLFQNRATDCSLTSGAIGLQAEGSRIQFRNLWVRQLR